MHTNNFILPLLKEYQSNKDYTINKLATIIDSLLLKAIDQKVSKINTKKHSKYNIVLDQSNGSINIRFNNDWHNIPPQKGMVFYLLSASRWIHYDGTNWIQG